MPQGRYGEENQSKEQSNRWKCPNCETINMGRECKICGTLRPILQTSDVSWSCRRCGYSNPREAKFCGKCGEPEEEIFQAHPFRKIVLSVFAVLVLLIILLKFVIMPSTQPVQTALAPEKVLATAPTAVAHIHSWIEATTTSPKTCSLCGETEGTPIETKPVEPPVPQWLSEIRNASIGDVIHFGAYRNDKAGTKIQAIQWDVMEVRGNKILLMSHYGLDCIQYNERYAEVTWENSSIRTWLNETFLYEAFTSDERQYIDLTHVDNSASQGFDLWKTSGGEDTLDYIFLLSYAEAKAYFNISGPGTNGPIKARILATDYAVEHGAFVSDEYQNADQQFATRWWLRSPGINQYDAACVHSRGCVGEHKCTTGDTCIRPVMWIDLEKSY